MRTFLQRVFHRDPEYGKMLDRIKFDSLTADHDGVLDLKLIEEYDEDSSKRVMEAMAVSLIRMLGNAPNYVEMKVKSPRVAGHKEFILTVQRAENPTPHQLRKEAEAELEKQKFYDGVELDRVLAALHVALAYADGRLEDEPDDKRQEELQGCWLVLQEHQERLEAMKRD